MANLSREQLLDLIDIGIQAPSADNFQPWTFRLIPDGFELGLDPRELGKFFDAQRFATKIACGALIENVVRLASAQGLETSIQYLDHSSSSGSDDLQVARLEFKKERKPGDVEGVRRLIRNRHTSRLFYDSKKALPRETLSDLIAETEKTASYRLVAYEDKALRNRIIRAVASSDTVRFTSRKNHEEFYESLRLGKSGATARDGLAEDTLALEKAAILGLKSMRSWALQRLANSLGLHYLSAFRGSWLPMKSSSEIVSIVHRGVPDHYEFGRVMERFWLRANELGLSVQPMAALPLYFARLSLLKGEGFSPAQLRKLFKVADEFNQVTRDFNPKTDQLVMMFRVGYTDRSAPRSRRRDVKDFILNDSEG